MEGYFDDIAYKNEDFTTFDFEKAEFENCTFVDCNLANSKLSESLFSECSFVSCDLSMARLNNTAFQSVKFMNCKLIGLSFNECNPFLLNFEFEACILSFSSFYEMKIKNTRFKNCLMEEVDLSVSDLSKAVFFECNLKGAIFEETTLEEADFSTASNFSIDPELNNIKKAKFSIHNVSGLLEKYNIIIE